MKINLSKAYIFLFFSLLIFYAKVLNAQTSKDSIETLNISWLKLEPYWAQNKDSSIYERLNILNTLEEKINNTKSSNSNALLINLGISTDWQVLLQQSLEDSANQNLFDVYCYHQNRDYEPINNGKKLLCTNCKDEGNEHINHYQIIEKETIKIGLLYMLKPDKNNSIQKPRLLSYTETIESIHLWAKYLKKKQHCDFILCVAEHYSIAELINGIKNSAYIDLWLLDSKYPNEEKIWSIKNTQNKENILFQVGEKSKQFGSINFQFSKKKKFLSPNAQTVILLK